VLQNHHFQKAGLLSITYISFLVVVSQGSVLFAHSNSQTILYSEQSTLKLYILLPIADLSLSIGKKKPNQNTFVAFYML